MSEERTITPTLNALVDVIAQTADPDKIILFGSQVRGETHPDSDYDFLVVVPDVENERQVSRRIYRALLDQGIGVAVDIIVVDRESLAQHRDTPGFVYQQALAEGEVCYENGMVSQRSVQLVGQNPT